jgi:parallel beta-helix repeat protein
LGELLVLPPNLPQVEGPSQNAVLEVDGAEDQPGLAVLKASDFGVRSNNSADQTVGLQRVINEAQALGASVYLAAGTYVISRPLLVRGIELRGAGVATIIKQTANKNGINLLSGGHIHDIVLRGTGVELPAHGINMGSTVNASVEGCTIEGWGGKGINTGGNSTGNLIRGNVILDNLDEGIYLGQNSSNNVIQDNLIARNAYNGIDVNSSGNTIRGNLIYQNGNRAGVKYRSASDRQGLLIVSLSGQVIDGNLVEENVVYQNYIHGIELQSVANSRNHGNHIARNVVEANGTTGNGFGDGITIDGTAGGEIGANLLSDNLVRGNQRYGILVDSSSGDQILKNLIDYNGPAQGGGGIVLRHLTHDAFVSRNTAVTNSGPAFQALPGTRDIVVADDNHLEDAAPKPIGSATPTLRR